MLWILTRIYRYRRYISEEGECFGIQDSSEKLWGVQQAICVSKNVRQYSYWFTTCTSAVSHLIPHWSFSQSHMFIHRVHALLKLLPFPYSWAQEQPRHASADKICDSCLTYLSMEIDDSHTLVPWLKQSSHLILQSTEPLCWRENMMGLRPILIMDVRFVDAFSTNWCIEYVTCWCDVSQLNMLKSMVNNVI